MEDAYQEGLSQGRSEFDKKHYKSNQLTPLQPSKDFILTINHRICFENEKSLRKAWFIFSRLLEKYRENTVMKVFNHKYEPHYGLNAIIKGREIIGFIPKNKIKSLKNLLK